MVSFANIYYTKNIIEWDQLSIDGERKIALSLKIEDIKNMFCIKNNYSKHVLL